MGKSGSGRGKGFAGMLGVALAGALAAGVSVGCGKGGQERKCPTTLAQLQLSDMGYVIQLCDGRFLVIDGGASQIQQVKVLMDYLREKSLTEKPVIAGWFITHSHGDHIGVLRYVASHYQEDITVECLGYTFPDPSRFDAQVEAGNSYAPGEQKETIEDIQMWEEKIVPSFPEAELWDMKSGDSRTFADVRVDVLMDANNKYPEEPCLINEVSGVFKLTFTQGTEDAGDDTSFMVLGDSQADHTVALMDETSDVYVSDEVLKSDVLQIAHHGVSIGGATGGHTDWQLALYQKIAPSVCFWPRFGWDFRASGEQNVWLLDDPGVQHFYNDQTTVIDMSDLSASTWVAKKER